MAKPVYVVKNTCAVPLGVRYFLCSWNFFRPSYPNAEIELHFSPNNATRNFRTFCERIKSNLGIENYYVE